MQCPRCRHENEASAKFCEDCAAPLARRCENCGHHLSTTAKFCPECAHPTDTAAAAAPQLRTPESYTPKHLAERILTSKAALEGERKQVTVLFADLKGSMELLADRDPEDARKLLDPVLEHMMEAVHRYEGTVNQVMGDGIMALFGAPIAHEDHAVRACYAALRMQESARRYAEMLRRSHGVEVQVRIGLNSGDVVVRSIGSDLRMDYTAVGQTTHLAARMEQLAAPGSILITPETLGLAQGYLVVKSLGPRPIRGLPALREIYEVVGAATVRSRFQAAVSRGLTQFVGRESELDQLQRALGQARAGRGQVVAVVGEPGVGKSRLLYEVTHSALTHDWLVLEGSAVSYGTAMSYLPLIAQLKGYFNIQDRDDPRVIREKVTGKLLTLDDALRPMLPAVLALLVPVDDAAWRSLDAPQRRRRTLDALKALLLREAREHPLLLVVEDLHWIDGETQALLDSLVETLPSARVLLLVSSRPEYQHPWDSQGSYSQIRLDTLPTEGAKELLDALLGDDPGLMPLKRLLVGRGNPFFLEETVRTLVETKALVGESGQYRLTKPIQVIEVPPTVQMVLAARMDRLHPEDKRLLQTASVVGKDLPFALLQAVAELPDEALRRGLERLRAAEFLDEIRRAPDLEYTFKHALTHEVAYGTLLRERRRALHAQLVIAIEHLCGERLTEQIDRLAHHARHGEVWDKAVKYGTEAGAKAIARAVLSEAEASASTLGDPLRPARIFSWQGEVVTVRSRHEQTLAHLGRALELLADQPESAARDAQEIKMQLALAESLRAARGYGAPDVERTLARIRVLVDRLTDVAQKFFVHWSAWRIEFSRANFRGAEEQVDQMLAIASDHSNPILRVGAHLAAGVDKFYLGEFIRARELLSRAISLYDRTQSATQTLHYGQDMGVAAWGFLAWADAIVGDLDGAARRADVVLQLAREIRHPFSLALALFLACEICELREDIDAVRPLGAELAALSREHGFPFFLAIALTHTGWAISCTGDVDAGVGMMREGSELFRAVGQRVGLAHRARLADGLLAAGNIDAALDVIADAMERQRETGEHAFVSTLLSVRGEALAKCGDVEGARQSLRQAIEVANQQGAVLFARHAAAALRRLEDA